MSTKQVTLIVVLGSPNDANGKLLLFALARCHSAYIKYKSLIDSGNSCRVICTGGFGEHFNTTKEPHASYLKQHLISLGVSSNSFLSNVDSRFTFEDACMCNGHFKQNPEATIVVVSSDFHMERVKLIFKGVFPKRRFEFVASKSEVTTEEKIKLVSHERSVMNRELINIANYHKKQA